MLVLAALLVLWSNAAVWAAEPAVAFGTRHAIALRTNGDVVTWGENVMCQLGRASSGNRDPNPRLAMRNGIEVAAAAEHSLVLTADGKVYGWGMNAAGPLGTGTEYDECEGPALIQSLADKAIVHIATGYGFSVAVTRSGDLYCAGDSSVGQCPTGNAGRVSTFALVSIPELAGNVVAVKAGAFHTLALTRDGRLYAFGRGREGQLGNGKTANGAVLELAQPVSFSAGTWHSVAVQKDGTVWTWGSNNRSQLCDGTTTNRPVPTRLAPLPGQSRMTQVEAGGHSTMMKAGDGSIYVCGDNQVGQIGVDQRPAVPQPTKLPPPVAASAVLSAGGANAAFSPDGCALRVAGDNTYAVVSAGETAPAVNGFTPRPSSSLCAPAAATLLPNLIREVPRGGQSGCWTARKDEDDARSPKWAPLRQAMLTAEDLLRRNTAFLAAPEPVRMRTSLSAGRSAESGARMHIGAIAERKADGTRIWTAGCEVIPQVDRIGGGIAQVSIFFNPDARGQFIGSSGDGPRLDGTRGRISRVQRLDRHYEGRPPALDPADARRQARRGRRAPRQGACRLDQDENLDEGPRSGSAAEDVRDAQEDRPGRRRADDRHDEDTGRGDGRQQERVFPATTAALEKQVRDYRQYRASFSAEALQSPAVWGDPAGEGRRQLEPESPSCAFSQRTNRSRWMTGPGKAAISCARHRSKRRAAIPTQPHACARAPIS